MVTPEEGTGVEPITLTRPGPAGAVSQVTGQGDPGQGSPDRGPRHLRTRQVTGQATGQGDQVTKLPPIPRSILIADWISMGPLTAIVGVLAGMGQFAFALWAGVPWWAAWAATAIFELTMIAFLVRGYLRARDNLSPAVMWIVAVAIGGLSVFTNVVHTDSLGAGLFYGSASAMVLALWMAKLYDSYRRVLRIQGKVIVPIGKFGRVWVLNPRLAWRAMLVGTYIQSDDVLLLLRLAWTWRAIFRSARIRKLARDLSKITAWNAVYTEVGLPTIELPAAVVAQVTLVRPVTPTDLTGQVTGDLTEKDEPPVEQWEREETDRLTGQATDVTSQVTKARKPVSAPVSPAPATEPSAELQRWFVTYRDPIDAVKRYVTKWDTRPERVTVGEIKGALVQALDAGELDKIPTGQPTLLKIRRAVEALSDRGAIPEEVTR